MRRRDRQALLRFPERGGARKGAGRKPRGRRAGVEHRRRPSLSGRDPLHVTMKVRDGCPSLRSGRTWRVVRAGLEAAKERFGARLVHFSVQRDHLHLIVEAADVRALMRAMRALAIRLAMRLNRWWRRRGRVFADRYHARVLRTPREVRHALAYVLLNGRRHGVTSVGIDPCSSGAWFDGWAGLSVRAPAATAIVAAARTWLLRLGWRRHGPIRFGEVPGRR